MPNLLIVDDEKGYREVLSVVFEADGYAVRCAPHGQGAIAQLKKEPADLIISDVRMPDMDGIELLKHVRSLDSDIGVVMMTAYGTIDTAREAFKLGADDFVQKPFNNDELRLIVRRTLERRAIVSENRAFRTAQRARGRRENIVGGSAVMQELYSTIETIAREQATVLITGESGTGKELVARAIHDLSDRGDRPFIPINCGALPDTLLESELFGFMKGAFTGASESRAGMFEASDKGTIFLDEIGDMSQAMQVKILRVLQERRIRRIGASNEVSVDTRVIAATNRDLRPMVEDGSFRQDLFYRISVIPLRVPPLRERREDIPDLVKHFVKIFSSRSGKKVGISQDAVNALMNRPWEGNVRELEHAIERAVALTPSGAEITGEKCTGENGSAGLPILFPQDGIHLPTHLNEIEKAYVEEALHRADGNRTRAAALLKMPVHAYRHLLGKHGL